MKFATKVQILDHTICVSLCFNAFENVCSPLSIGKVVGQTEFKKSKTLNSKPVVLRLTIFPVSYLLVVKKLNKYLEVLTLTFMIYSNWDSYEILNITACKNCWVKYVVYSICFQTFLYRHLKIVVDSLNFSM